MWPCENPSCTDHAKWLYVPFFGFTKRLCQKHAAETPNGGIDCIPVDPI